MRATPAKLPPPSHQSKWSRHREATCQIGCWSLALLQRHPFRSNRSQLHTASRLVERRGAARSKQGTHVLFRQPELAENLLLASSTRSLLNSPAPAIHRLQAVPGHVLQHQSLRML